MFRDTGAWIMDKRSSFIELPPLSCHFGASAQVFHNGVILRRCFDEIEEWLPHFSRFRPGDALHDHRNFERVIRLQDRLFAPVRIEERIMMKPRNRAINFR